MVDLPLLLFPQWEFFYMVHCGTLISLFLSSMCRLSTCSKWDLRLNGIFPYVKGLCTRLLYAPFLGNMDDGINHRWWRWLWWVNYISCSVWLNLKVLFVKKIICQSRLVKTQMTISKVWRTLFYNTSSSDRETAILLVIYIKTLIYITYIIYYFLNIK